MSRILGGLAGLIMALFPAQFLATMQNLAVDNPDAFTVRRWVTPYVRLYGLLIALACLVGGKAYRVCMLYVGGEGIAMLLAPRHYVEFGNGLSYDGEDPFEWKNGYLPSVRACGAFFVFLAVKALTQPDGAE